MLQQGQPEAAHAGRSLASWSALIAAIPLLQYAGRAIIAIAATGMIYLSYFLGNLAILRARLNGWPKTKAPFKLGKWGIPVTMLALVWGGGMLINFAWPRAATNPTPDQTAPAARLPLGLAERPAGAVDGRDRDRLVGAAYYVLVQRKKPAHMQAPEGEVYAQEAPEAPSASTA